MPPRKTDTPTASSSASAPSAAGPPREISRGAGHRPEVALTFHGAGDPDLARQILALVAATGARITLMAVGRWLASSPEMARDILSAGHELGNHTWSHQTLNRLNRPAALNEIDRCRAVLTRLTGSPGTYFRQSGSQHATAQTRALAGGAGYRICLSYGLDSLDWTDPGPNVIRAELARARAGTIVSMHLGHAGTVSALPAILGDLRRRGLAPVTVSELLAS